MTRLASDAPACQFVEKPKTGRFRDPKTGRFAPKGAAWAVAPALLPTGRFAWAAGNQFFADRAAAVRHAVARRPGVLAPPEPAKPVRPKVGRRGYLPLATRPAAGVAFGAGL